jgi:hypothetical protein
VRGRKNVLPAKNPSAQFIAEALGFPWVGGVAKALGKVEELMLFGISRRNIRAYDFLRRTHCTNMHEDGVI